MATEYDRAPDGYPDNGDEETSEPATFELEVTAKVVTKPTGPIPKTTRVAETK